LVRISLVELLNKAETEEKNYNWEEAAELYEQVAKGYLDKKNLIDAAKAYDKFGEICIRTVRASESKADYVKWRDRSVKAFNSAERLFKQENEKLLSMECKAKALSTISYVVTSIEDAEKDLKQSRDILLNLCQQYSKTDDTENVIKISLLILNSINELTFISADPSEIYNNCQLSREIIENTWKLIKEFDSINFRVDLMQLENSLINVTRWTELIYPDKKEEEVRKRFLMRCEETLALTENCNNYTLLGTVYLVTGTHYCMYGGLYAKEPNKRLQFAEEGFELMEKGLLFCRKSKDYISLVVAIYVLNYQAGIFGRFEYYQKRILHDIQEFQTLSKVYDGFYTWHTTLTYLLPVVYYNDFTSRSFLTPDTRKSYAKAGIERAKVVLEKTVFGPFLAITNQMITHLYSQQVILATEEEDPEIYIQQMFQYAKMTENIAKEYRGGNIRSAGLTSIYRAYKTMVDFEKKKGEKIQNFEVAIEAAKNNIKYSVESYRTFLAFKMRLGLLYEELGILTMDEKHLMQARELFLRVIEETSEKGYPYYTAAACEYIARLEDRLGNQIASAEYYKKAEKFHNDSLLGIEFKPLKNRVEEKIKYAQAWNLIEKAKAFHKREQHLNAKEGYRKASEILTNLPRFNYEANYYGAWVFLEEAEEFSKQEKYNEAIASYEKTKEHFDTATFMIRFIRKNVRRSKELKKLGKAARVRINYCSARINLEEARILGRQGEHVAAAEKFALASTQFKDTCLLFNIKKERKELEAVYHLCRAWERMELAEQFEDPLKFKEAAEIFTIASDFFTGSKLKFLAQGNSNFCAALEEGCKFDQSDDIDVKTLLFPKVKSILRKAANSYEKGGFKNGAAWALATSTYFDATWHLIRADEELDISKKQEILRIGSTYLKSAAELFGESGYKEREREILERLNRLLKEEEILVSALNTIKKPSVSQSVEGLVAPSCPVETSQSPRISEINEYTEESISFAEKDGAVKKYKLEYKDLLKESPETQKKSCKVGIAQIGLSGSGDIVREFYEEKDSGLLSLREDKIEIVKTKVNDMVQKAHNNGIDILIFPEMSIDLNYKSFLEDLSRLAKVYNMYIVPGSYHDHVSKQNVSIIIGPEGLLWEQKKHIPAIIHFGEKKFKEGILTGSYPQKTVVCNTKFGRIAILICRDFLDMDLRVELKNFEPPVDIVINPAFTPVTADFKAAHFDARRSIYAYCFFANIAEYGESFIYTPEKERVERNVPAREEDLIFKDVDLFRLRSERKKWEIEQLKEKRFIQSTR